MGYACPVCGDPQADAVHLANHLAFTALTRGGDHEAWLDEHVPEWDDHGESWLADRVVEHATEAEFPQVFEDTTGDHTEHEGDHGAGDRGTIPGTDDLDGTVDRALSEVDEADVDEVLEEARELTRQRRADEESETE